MKQNTLVESPYAIVDEVITNRRSIDMEEDGEPTINQQEEEKQGQEEELTLNFP